MQELRQANQIKSNEACARQCQRGPTAGSSAELGNPESSSAISASMRELRQAILCRCGFLDIQSVSHCRRRRKRGDLYQTAFTLTIDDLPPAILENELLQYLASMLSTSGLPSSLRAGRLYVMNAEGTCVVNLRLHPSRPG